MSQEPPHFLITDISLRHEIDGIQLPQRCFVSRNILYMKKTYHKKEVKMKFYDLLPPKNKPYATPQN